MSSANSAPESRINCLVIGSIVVVMLILGIGLGIAMKHSPEDTRTWRIAITNWPGFDPLYIAEQKGFLQQQGLDIELVPINSLTDIRKAFERGTVDGYSGTVMDAIESVQETATPHHIVLVTDYSKGGDQLLADPSITTVEDLRGKRVSLEITSPVARYIMARALSGSSVSQSEMDVRPYNQSILADQVTRGNLDAVVTYEPYSSMILAQRPMKVLFSSADIPEEVLDAIMVSPAMLNGVPNLSERLQHAWQAALDYSAAHPAETNAMLAARYKVDVPTYISMLNDIHILNRNDMQRLASHYTIQQTLWSISQIITQSTPLTREQIAGMVNVWYQKEAR